MKQLFFLLAIITICNLTVSAQIKKGSIYLGGDISAYSQKRDNSSTHSGYKNTSVGFNISAGQFVKQNLVIGIYGGYSHYKYNYISTGTAYYRNQKGDNYNAGLFAKQYKKLAKDFYFFGELGAGYIGSSETDVDMPVNITTKYKRNGGDLHLTPGISYRIYKKLNVELSVPRIVGIQYSVLKETSPGVDATENQFNLSSNISSSFWNSLGLGFRFIF